jgi:hypothetical protein
MNYTHRLHSARLIALGLFGMAALHLALHLPHPMALERDGVQGLWLGLCLGMQLLGLARLRKWR